VRPAVAAALFIGASLLAGAAGAFATANAQSFYAQLVQPSWAPPPSLFGPVWTLLYLLMGIAAFLVWRAHGWRGALTFFLVHLAVNALWSWLFFHWHLGTASIVEIVVLWLMVATLAVMFYRLRPVAAALLLPYLGWVTFATALNITLVRLNPALLT
jgi:tryptophan-rich sensory protein